MDSASDNADDGIFLSRDGDGEGQVEEREVVEVSER